MKVIEPLPPTPTQFLIDVHYQPFAIMKKKSKPFVHPATGRLADAPSARQPIYAQPEGMGCAGQAEGPMLLQARAVGDGAVFRAERGEKTEGNL